LPFEAFTSVFTTRALSTMTVPAVRLGRLTIYYQEKTLSLL
jgi:hypothetical protein